jgi:hypothetical protein
MKYLFRNDQTFHIIFASAMKRDYLVYPSMIGAKSGLIWSYDEGVSVSIFDDTHPLEVSVSQCGVLSICRWYVSPIWHFNETDREAYALLGEWDKLTAVSRQRFVSITTNTEKTQTIVVVQAATSEKLISILLSRFNSNTELVSCPPSAATGQVNFVITSTNCVCS